MRSSLSRRRLLAFAGAGLLGVTAGCSSPGGEGEDGEEGGEGGGGEGGDEEEEEGAYGSLYSRET